MDLLDLVIFALRIALVVALYMFLFVVLRLAIGGLRAPARPARPAPAVPASAPSPSPSPAPGPATSTPRAPLPGPLRLVVLDPGQSGLRIGTTLAVDRDTLLGRGDRADLALADATVSGAHARLARQASGWTVVDLGSTNGTRVNDAPLRGDQPRALAVDDVLALGNIRLRVGDH